MKGSTKLVAGVITVAVLASVTPSHHGHGGLGGVLDSFQVAPAPSGVSSSVASNVALGQRLAARKYGWTGSQWNCLYALWNRESGWSNTALNPKSGADGIAQALGHGPTNQYPAGPANPPTNSPRAQIKWGLGYVQATYGSPCGAWAHEQADSWY